MWRLKYVLGVTGEEDAVDIVNPFKFVIIKSASYLSTQEYIYLLVNKKTTNFFIFLLVNNK